MKRESFRRTDPYQEYLRAKAGPYQQYLGWEIPWFDALGFAIGLRKIVAIDYNDPLKALKIEVTSNSNDSVSGNLVVCYMTIRYFDSILPQLFKPTDGPSPTYY